MHILPHISLFLLALVLSRSASFMLSWCSLLNVSNDHSVICHNTLLEPSIHSCPHFQFIWLHTVSVMNPMYCTVSCCTMWLSFATLPVIVWKRSRAASLSFYLSLSFSICLCLFLSLSLALSVLSLHLSCLASLCLPLSLQFFVLFFVFLHHFSPSWVAQACKWPMSSVSRCISP